jgi:uncharacterized cupin superfamily protein
MSLSICWLARSCCAKTAARSCFALETGVANGHCLVNRSDRDAVYLEIGTRAVRERAEYPDIDMRMERDEKSARFLHKSGEPY